MPHACTRLMFLAARFSIKDCGTADPPQIIMRRAERSKDSRSNKPSRPIQSVGTPPASVTRSSDIKRAVLWGSIKRPGNTNLAPIIAHACARPQALAWNIGTIGSTVSCSESPIPSAMPTAIEWRKVERWL